MLKLLKSVLVIAAFAAGLSACGGKDEDSTTTATGAATGTETGTATGS